MQKIVKLKNCFRLEMLWYQMWALWLWDKLLMSWSSTRWIPLHHWWVCMTIVTQRTQSRCLRTPMSPWSVDQWGANHLQSYSGSYRHQFHPSPYPKWSEMGQLYLWYLCLSWGPNWAKCLQSFIELEIYLLNNFNSLATANPHFWTYLFFSSCF